MVQKFQPFHWTVSVVHLNKSTFVLFLSEDFLEKWLFFKSVDSQHQTLMSWEESEPSFIVEAVTDILESLTIYWMI